jgi:hypothetical protein
MKKFTFFFLILLTVGFVYGQKTAVHQVVSGPTTVITASKFQITKPLNTMFTKKEIDNMDFESVKEMPDREHRLPQKFLFTVADGPQYGNDPSTVQTKMGTRQPKGVLTHWDGQAGTADPLDPTGRAGMTQYVQAVNATPFAVYDKAGTGTPTFTGDLGAVTGSTGNAGDPIVMYDKFADRWFLAQLNLYVGFAIAVSATNDPTGSWYAWQFWMPGYKMPDYLKFSVWQNGYYMTSNNGSGLVLCFERDAMLAGTAGARMVSASFTTPTNAGFGFWLPLPGDADGVLPPAGQKCPLFSYTDDGWGGGATDGINIWSVDVDWGTTPTETITLDASIPTASFDASYESTWNDISQPGTQMLDGIGGVCNYRAQWNSFIGTNRVVLNWGVKMSPTSRSIKWVELRQNQTDSTWSLYQEGIYAPDTVNRWCGSIAMDCNGDIALCYSKASPDLPVSMAFTGRIPGDPLGTMSLTETTVIAGTGSKTSSNRWGDYSETSIDPADGSIFWHTGMYCNNGATTGIYSFQIAPCLNGIADNNVVTPQLTAIISGNQILVKASDIPTNDENVVQLYDVSGKLIKVKTIKPVAHGFETTVDVSGLSAGIYIVRIGTPDYQKVAKVAIP